MEFSNDVESYETEVTRMSQNSPFLLQYYSEAIVQLPLVANQYRIRILVYFNSDIYLVKTLLIHSNLATPH